MSNHIIPQQPPEVTAFVAPNGHTIITQGFYHQALFIHSNNVAGFVRSPSTAPVLVIPPFAAQALNCYLLFGTITAISLRREPEFSENFNITVTNQRGFKFGYFSDFEALAEIKSHAQNDYDIVITPSVISAIHQKGAKSKFSIVTSLPESERPDFRQRFAVAPAIVAEALREALRNSATTQ